MGPQSAMALVAFCVAVACAQLTFAHEPSLLQDNVAEPTLSSDELASLGRLDVAKQLPKELVERCKKYCGPHGVPFVVLEFSLKPVRCHCDDGFAGDRCDRCAPLWGPPGVCSQQLVSTEDLVNLVSRFPVLEAKVETLQALEESHFLELLARINATDREVAALSGKSGVFFTSKVSIPAGKEVDLTTLGLDLPTEFSAVMLQAFGSATQYHEFCGVEQVVVSGTEYQVSGTEYQVTYTVGGSSQGRAIHQASSFLLAPASHSSPTLSWTSHTNGSGCNGNSASLTVLGVIR